jgi:hypothetical protein
MEQRWTAPPSPPLRSVEKVLWHDPDRPETDLDMPLLASFLSLQPEALTSSRAREDRVRDMLADLSPDVTRHALNHLGEHADEEVDVDVVRLARDLRMNAVVLGCAWHLFGKAGLSHVATHETSIDWSIPDARRPDAADLQGSIQQMFDDMDRHRRTSHTSAVHLADPGSTWGGVTVDIVHGVVDLKSMSMTWNGVVLDLIDLRIPDTALMRHHGRAIRDIVPHPLLPGNARLVDHVERRGIQTLVTDRKPQAGSWREAAQIHLMR